MASLMTTLGVLADTHIPDREPQLNPRILEIFQLAKVDVILHAGDVSTSGVLDELKQVAPVYAVQGNRDIVYLRQLPLRIEMDFEGVSIGMAHGHGTFSRYMVDKIHRAVSGRKVGRYLLRLLQAFPAVDVIVFGHLHVPCNFRLKGKLFFNPGSTSYPWPRGDPATLGLLHIDGNAGVEGEIISLG
jgi:putative phosphoesterase